MKDYTITFHMKNRNEPVVHTKSRFGNASRWVEKLMVGLKPGEKITIERK